MKGYKSKTKTVNAIQWDGKYTTIKKIPNDTFIFPPEYDRARETLMLHVAEGGLMPVEKWDFIILRDDGKLEVQSYEEFKMEFITDE